MTVFYLCMTSIAFGNDLCMPEGFTFTDGSPDYSKGLLCKGSETEHFFLMTDDASIIEEIIFKNDTLQQGVLCTTSKDLDFIHFGEHLIERKTLILHKNDEKIGECQLLPSDILREVAERYLHISLSKNKL